MFNLYDDNEHLERRNFGTEVGQNIDNFWMKKRAGEEMEVNYKERGEKMEGIDKEIYELMDDNRRGRNENGFEEDSLKRFHKEMVTRTSRVEDNEDVNKFYKDMDEERYEKYRDRNRKRRKRELEKCFYLHMKG
jgi:hypothetical protein